MEVNKEVVKKVARISRLELDEKELETYTKDLKEILKAFEVLEKVDTSKEKPTFQPIEVKNVLREDKVDPSLLQKEVLDMTENKENGFIKGPKVVN